MPYAYGLRADHEDSYLGGVLHVNGQDVDVKKLLDEGGGTIVTDDELLATVLDGYPALKRVSLKAAEENAAKVAAEDPDTSPANAGNEPVVQTAPATRAKR